MSSRGSSSGNGNSMVVPSSLSEVLPFFRVANEVESTNRRVAYLCRFCAFEKAHRLDPTSRGAGVRDFKSALLQLLERENESTKLGRIQESDESEMRSYIQNVNSCTTATTLIEVLKALKDLTN